MSAADGLRRLLESDARHNKLTRAERAQIRAAINALDNKQTAVAELVKALDRVTDRLGVVIESDADNGKPESGDDVAAYTAARAILALNGRIDELEQALAETPAASVEDYERELSAVMPEDFKDWHQNDRREWPAVAAAVIRNLREREAMAWKQAASMDDEVREWVRANMPESYANKPLIEILKLMNAAGVEAEQDLIDSASVTAALSSEPQA